MRKIKMIASLALAACTVTSVAGYAQDRGPGGDDRGRPPMGHEQGQNHDSQRGYNDRGRDGDHGRQGDGRWEGDKGHRDEGYGIDRRADRPGPGHWHKGERVPTEYRQRQYVIDDWRAYRLSPPPRGYQWVGVGGDYFLVAVPTGVVFQVVIGG